MDRLMLVILILCIAAASLHELVESWIRLLGITAASLPELVETLVRLIA